VVIVRSTYLLLLLNGLTLSAVSAPSMPAAASRMNGLDDFFPSGDLFRGVDAGCVGVPVAERGDGGCFSNDQSGGGSLAIVLGI